LFTQWAWAQNQAFDNPLFIPPQLHGTVFNLHMQKGVKEFKKGIQTHTYGVNGNYLAPTVVFRKGDWVKMNVINELGEPTTMHWHGMHVPPKADGGPHSIIDSGATWSPSFKVMDRATTMWYHPHLHHNTQRQVNRGLAGLIMIKDENEARLNLPRMYGIDDIPLILQDRTFDANGDFIIAPMGNEMLVNGTIAPSKKLPAQMVRFRVLNGSNQRTYNLGVSDNRVFYQIGSDGGLLKAPVQLKRLRLSPGERAEIVVDFSQDAGKRVFLTSYASEIPKGIPGGPPPPGAPTSSPLDGVDFHLLAADIYAPFFPFWGVYSLPTKLSDHQPWLESEANRTRTKRFKAIIGSNGRPIFTIDGKVFDMMEVNDTIKLGDIEVWELVNETDLAHPFHIHDIQFYILDRNGSPPPANEQGLKDVVLVEPFETVRFITKFDDFADDTVPFMYHCHMLPHEDEGMMGQFLVLNPDQFPVPNPLIELSVYPSPAKSKTTVRVGFGTPTDFRLEVISIATGRCMFAQEANVAHLKTELDLLTYPKGMFVVRVSTARRSYHQWLIKE
jgi:bilirubin oxidase